MWADCQSAMLSQVGNMSDVPRKPDGWKNGREIDCQRILPDTSAMIALHASGASLTPAETVSRRSSAPMLQLSVDRITERGQVRCVRVVGVKANSHRDVAEGDLRWLASLAVVLAEIQARFIGPLGACHVDRPGLSGVEISAEVLPPSAASSFPCLAAVLRQQARTASPRRSPDENFLRDRAGLRKNPSTDAPLLPALISLQVSPLSSSDRGPPCSSWPLTLPVTRSSSEPSGWVGRPCSTPVGFFRLPRGRVSCTADVSPLSV